MSRVAFEYCFLCDLIPSDPVCITLSDSFLNTAWQVTTLCFCPECWQCATDNSELRSFSLYDWAYFAGEEYKPRRMRCFEDSDDTSIVKYKPQKYLENIWSQQNE